MKDDVDSLCLFLLFLSTGVSTKASGILPGGSVENDSWIDTQLSGSTVPTGSVVSTGQGARSTEFGVLRKHTHSEYAGLPMPKRRL